MARLRMRELCGWAETGIGTTNTTGTSGTTDIGIELSRAWFYMAG